ncbi:MAG TPA: SAM-dependent methyltransferase, partial [Alcanivorax sp.]|nr:SAM-dependent methyltransferase [Alcanivorax sp.]
GDARRLPYPDGHFDTVVACLVFCTIPEPELAAREMHRVLAPGGRLLLLEHIASGRPRTFRWQRRVDPLWHHLACGCHLTRPTPDTLRDAGFDLSDTRVFRHRKLPGLMAELLQGSARRAD